LLPQIGLIVTVFLLWKTSGASFSNFLPTQKSGAISYLFAFGVLFGLVFGFGWLNTLFLRLLEKIGYEPPQSVLPNLSNFGTYLLAVVVIACLPALGEELLFRGAMTAGVKGESLFKSVLLCGVCFSVFHQNPAQTPYQLLCGAVFALILFQTENLLLTLFMHFINNFYIITATYLQLPNFSTEWQIALAALGIAVFAVSIGYFLTRKPPKKQQSGSLKSFLLYALPGLVICITLWVYNFMKGMVS
jgi:membrane protease YdiL (CAAX protease family)